MSRDDFNSTEDERPPEEAISKAKQKRIIKVANNYLIENDLDNEGRFDIFGIIINQKTKKI